MRLLKINLKNFRCFKDAQLDLAPITILTGANSTGKSTILYALLSALQSKGSRRYPFGFEPNGEFCTLGSYKQVVAQQILKSNITIGLDFVWGLGQNEEESFSFNSEFFYVPRNDEIRVKSTEINAVDDSFFIRKNPGSKGYIAEYNSTRKSNKKDILNFESMVNFLESIEKNIEEELKSRKNEKKRSISTSEKMRKQFEENHFEYSAADLNKMFRLLNAHFRYRKMSTNFYQLIEAFKNSFIYVAPSRVYPARIFHTKSSEVSRLEPRGENLASLIYGWQKSKNDKIKELIDYGSAIKVFSDIKTQRLPDGLLQLLIKSSKASPSSSLQDVGFGVSQILPILCAEVLLGKDGTLAASQPELHLHPSAQSELAVHFATGHKERNNWYIIETHSEYMINRFKFLVANGDIEPDKIHIYHMTPSGNTIKPKLIKITEDGRLKGAPKDYFETYHADVFRTLMAEKKR